jgi:Abnormal spindle-like microcephaly-assoc'd, ASPM-SPD-2-Hydin
VKDLGTRTRFFLLFLSVTTMLGCGGLDASRPAVQQSAGLVAASPALDFGTVLVGNTAVRTNSIVNNTAANIIVTRAEIDQTDFRITGQKLPLKLAPGERTAVQIVYSPRSRGSAEGRVVLASNSIKWSTTFLLKGTAVTSGRISLTPASIRFGNVPVGTTQTQSATLSNSGISTVTITHAAISGRGFALTGVSLPLTLKGGQSAAIGVSFTPESAGPSSSTVSLVGTALVTYAGRHPRHGRNTPTDIALTTLSTTLNVPVSGTGTEPQAATGQLAVAPSSIALGRVKIGTSQTQSAALINSGTSNVTVSQARVVGSSFKMSGITFPVTLRPGQRKGFSITFAPQSAGTSSGSIAVTSDAPNSVVSVPVSGTAIVPGALISTPSSLGFGTVQVGHGQTLPEVLTNTGGSSITVSQASVTGASFAISGLTLPTTLDPGQSKSFSVTFSPQAGGPANGTLSIASDASNATLTIPLTASGLTVGSLTSAPSTLNFGNVQVGNNQTLSETLTNTGSSTITISQAGLSVAGFALSGLTLPATLAAGQSTTFNVTFTPQSSGATSGSLSIGSNASNASLTVPLTANAATAGVLSTSDSSLNFASVPVNTSATQSETLTNTGGSSVTITQANVTGPAFRITGLNLPLTLTPGQSFTFGSVFAPTTGGSATGSIAVVSNASDSTVTISLAGTATVSGQLAVSPSTLNFGNVIVGQTKSLTATLSASGSNVTISDASMSTSEFTISGLSLPVTLAAGQSTTFTVKFAPQASGMASASAFFTSNASNSSAVASLTGNATAPPQHSVSLSWNPSASSVVGYNVYRGTTTGGPYSKIAPMNADTSYADSSVQAGQTYFYVTTAVDASGKESARSNQVQAVVPSP